MTREIYEDGSKETSESMVAAGESLDPGLMDEYKAFVAQRFGEEAATQEGKVSRTLIFDKCPPEVQKRIIEARKAGWKKYCHFNAATPVYGQQLQQLLDEGHQLIPSQWVDVDKNAHLLTTERYEPAHRSRMVARGNSERDTKGEDKTGVILSCFYQGVLYSKHAVWPFWLGSGTLS